MRIQTGLPRFPFPLSSCPAPWPFLTQVLRQQHVLNSSPLDMMGEYKVNSAAPCTHACRPATHMACNLMGMCSIHASDRTIS